MDKTKLNSLLLDLRGRGAQSNTSSRFLKNQTTPDLSDAGWVDPDDQRMLKTQVFKDTSRTIIAENDSPDIPFRFSLNAYRGCEHGCSYCYARPTHEYFGLSAGLDFESKIFVKDEAPALLKKHLSSTRWEPAVVMMSGVTDCYQPIERHLKITRQCLEVFSEFRNPVGIITKNQLVVRDLDILKSMAEDQLVAVMISITTLDSELARVMEPRTSSPSARLQAIATLAEAGIPVGVNAAPLIPGLTDHELPHILKAASEAGAKIAGYTSLRLPHSVKDIFTEWIQAHRPEQAEKVLNSIKRVRGGDLYRSNFSSRMRGEGPQAENTARLFDVFCQRYQLNQNRFQLSTSHFKRPQEQLSLF